MANADRLHRFRALASIDTIATRGNYTHDAVFHLDADFVKGLELLYYEQAMYSERRNSARHLDQQPQKDAPNNRN